MNWQLVNNEKAHLWAQPIDCILMWTLASPHNIRCQAKRTLWKSTSGELTNNTPAQFGLYYSFGRRAIQLSSQRLRGAAFRMFEALPECAIAQHANDALSLHDLWPQTEADWKGTVQEWRKVEEHELIVSMNCVAFFPRKKKRAKCEPICFQFSYNVQSFDIEKYL